MWYRNRNRYRNKVSRILSSKQLWRDVTGIASTPKLLRAEHETIFSTNQPIQSSQCKASHKRSFTENFQKMPQMTSRWQHHILLLFSLLVRTAWTGFIHHSMISVTELVAKSWNHWWKKLPGKASCVAEPNDDGPSPNALIIRSDLKATTGRVAD